MDSRIIPLYYLCSLAGLVIVAGGIWLLYKQKVYIDRESKEVTEIETPIGKFRTNIPALVLFALGFVPLIYPIWKTTGAIQRIHIRGDVKAKNFPVQVYAVIKSDLLNASGDFSLLVPILSDLGDEYKVILTSGPTILDARADLTTSKDGVVRVQTKDFTGIDAEILEPDDRHIPPRPPEFQ